MDWREFISGLPLEAYESASRLATGGLDGDMPVTAVIATWGAVGASTLDGPLDLE